MIYYAVLSKKEKTPQAIFRTQRWAERFIQNQQEIWNEKYKIKEVNIPRPNRQKLEIIHKITWIDYVFEGVKLLVISLNKYGKERYEGFFERSRRGIRKGDSVSGR